MRWAWFFIATLLFHGVSVTAKEIFRADECRELLVDLQRREGFHPFLTFRFGIRELTAEQLEEWHQFSPEKARAANVDQFTVVQVGEVAETLFHIDRFLLGKIALPKQVNINLHWTRHGAYSLGPNIVIPYCKLRSLVDGKEILNTPHKTRAIHAHEYGHQIFDVNLARRFPQLLGWQAQGVQFIEGVARDLERLINVPTAQAEANRLAQILLRKASDGLNYTRSLEIPYSELFADLVAVLSQDNPRTMVEALFFDGVPPQVSIDFTERVSATEWTRSEEHELLTPTRYFCWAGYLSKIPALYRRADFVASVLRAIESEVEFRYENRLYDLLPSEINLRLITAIGREVSPPR